MTATQATFGVMALSLMVGVALIQEPPSLAVSYDLDAIDIIAVDRIAIENMKDDEDCLSRMRIQLQEGFTQTISEPICNSAKKGVTARQYSRALNILWHRRKEIMWPRQRDFWLRQTIILLSKDAHGIAITGQGVTPHLYGQSYPPLSRQTTFHSRELRLDTEVISGVNNLRRVF